MVKRFSNYEGWKVGHLALAELPTDLYAGILIGDWDQTFALDITQKSSVFCFFHYVVFVSVSKLFKNENLQSYMITKIPAIIKSEF